MRTRGTRVEDSRSRFDQCRTDYTDFSAESQGMRANIPFSASRSEINKLYIQRLVSRVWPPIDPLRSRLNQHMDFSYKQADASEDRIVSEIKITYPY